MTAQVCCICGEEPAHICHTCMTNRLTAAVKVLQDLIDGSETCHLEETLRVIGTCPPVPRHPDAEGLTKPPKATSRRHNCVVR